jgi:hypothetical protein
MAATTLSDRARAGRLLAERLRKCAGRDDVLVLALPRGGVPVAFEIAQALRPPLDVFLVRKLGVPGHAELALGPIATGGVRVLNTQLIDSLGIPRDWVEAIDAKEMRELERRERAYRGDRPPPDLTDRWTSLSTMAWRPGPRCWSCSRDTPSSASSWTRIAIAERPELPFRPRRFAGGDGCRPRDAASTGAPGRRPVDCAYRDPREEIPCPKPWTPRSIVRPPRP